jgi:hypothetical protein
VYVEPVKVIDSFGDSHCEWQCTSGPLLLCLLHSLRQAHCQNVVRGTLMCS